MAFCHKCGKPVGAEERSCPWCGVEAPVSSATTGPSSRMEGHVRILAWLQIVTGILSVLGAAGMMVAMAFLTGAAAAQHQARPEPLLIVQGLLGALVILLLICGIVGIAAGVGLLRHRPWARTAVIVMSFLYLLNIPLGTLLGVYGLWVLMSSEGERYYSQVAAA